MKGIGRQRKLKDCGGSREVKWGKKAKEFLSLHVPPWHLHTSDVAGRIGW